MSSRLKAYGTKHLHVVDAGIVPLHVKGYGVSLTYVIAKMAVDLIKEDLGGSGDYSAGLQSPSDTASFIGRRLLYVHRMSSCRCWSYW